MSRFYGKLLGRHGGISTRCGHERLVTNAAGWQGAIEVTLSPGPGGTDQYLVELVPHPSRSGPRRTLASGILDATVDEYLQPAVGL